MTPSDRPEESGLQSGRQLDYVVQLLQDFNLPVTRENYLDLAYPEGLPEDLDETTLPEEIRLTQREDTLALFGELSKVTLPIDLSEPPESQDQQEPPA